MVGSHSLFCDQKLIRNNLRKTGVKSLRLPSIMAEKAQCWYLACFRLYPFLFRQGPQSTGWFCLSQGRSSLCSLTSLEHPDRHTQRAIALTIIGGISVTITKWSRILVCEAEKTEFWPKISGESGVFVRPCLVLSFWASGKAEHYKGSVWWDKIAWPWQTGNG